MHLIRLSPKQIRLWQNLWFYWELQLSLLHREQVKLINEIIIYIQTYAFFSSAGKCNQALEDGAISSILCPQAVHLLSLHGANNFFCFRAYSCQFTIKTFSFILSWQLNKHINTHRLHKLQWITEGAFRSHMRLWNKINVLRGKCKVLGDIYISPIITVHVTPLSWTFSVIFLQSLVLTKVSTHSFL